MMNLPWVLPWFGTTQPARQCQTRDEAGKFLFSAAGETRRTTMAKGQVRGNKEPKKPKQPKKPEIPATGFIVPPKPTRK